MVDLKAKNRMIIIAYPNLVRPIKSLIELARNGENYGATWEYLIILITEKKKKGGGF